MESEVNIEGNTTFVRNSAAVAGGENGTGKYIRRIGRLDARARATPSVAGTGQHGRSSSCVHLNPPTDGEIRSRNPSGRRAREAPLVQLTTYGLRPIERTAYIQFSIISRLWTDVAKPCC